MMPQDHLIVNGVGWAATGIFVGSYFFTRAEAIRRTQMAGALTWLANGLLIDAYPVIVANVLVFGAAGWSLARARWTRSARVSAQVSPAVGTSSTRRPGRAPSRRARPCPEA